MMQHNSITQPLNQHTQSLNSSAEIISHQTALFIQQEEVSLRVTPLHHAITQMANNLSSEKKTQLVSILSVALSNNNMSIQDRQIAIQQAITEITSNFANNNYRKQLCKKLS